MNPDNHNTAGNSVKLGKGGRALAGKADFTHPSFGTCRPDSRRIAVRWRAGISAPLRRRVLRLLGLIPHPEPLANGPQHAPMIIHQSERLSWLARADGGPVVGRLLSRLRQVPEIAWSAISYHAIHDSPTLLDSVFCIDPTRLYLQGNHRARMATCAEIALGMPTASPNVTQLAGVTVLRIPAASLVSGRGATFLAVKLAAEATRANVTLRLENIPLVDSGPSLLTDLQLGNGYLRRRSLLRRPSAPPNHGHY